MFLDYTYFEGGLYIPNLKYNDSEGVGAIIQAVNEQSLDWYIEKYEIEFLEGLLGETLYNKMVEGVDESENEGNIWNRLRDKIFINTGSGKYSPAANYVYFYAMREMQTQTSSQGEVRGKQDYATVKSAHGKLVNAWNDMVDMSQKIRKYVCENEALYGKLECIKKWSYINTFGI